MNTNTLNIPFLKAINACSEAIRFVERNKLEGFPLNRLDEVKGDYEGYVSWLGNALKTKREIDDRGNITSATCPDGRVYLYEYDDRGNMVRQTHPYGGVYLYEYDDHGNMISETHPDGGVYLYEYDDHGNMVRRTHPYGDEYRWEYDDRGNIISETDPGGRKHVRETEFYEDGQLKRICDLRIPWFEK